MGIAAKLAAIARSITSGGTLAGSALAVFVGSGSTNAAGAVPAPGSTAGTARFLREDATWAQAGFQNRLVIALAGTRTWVPPAGVTTARITVVGGGGNGGASGSSGAGGGGAAAVGGTNQSGGP